MLVLLAPAYVGHGGGPEGWYQAMLANTNDALRRYSRHLGQRYSGYSNIILVHGGDFNPPDKDRIRSVADRIREFDTRALHTAAETATIEYWKGEPWLQVNNAYAYKPVNNSAIDQYRRPKWMPFFLIESAYENEDRADERRIRTPSLSRPSHGRFRSTFMATAQSGISTARGYRLRRRLGKKRWAAAVRRA
jgi:Protein of unknown function (DUF4038)